MYEFTKKEIRAKFKETEYGKKTNKMFYTSLIVFGVSILLVIVFVGISMGIYSYEAADGSIVMDNLVMIILINLSAFLTYLSFILVLYFDGKRDGAIEQFKRTM